MSSKGRNASQSGQELSTGFEDAYLRVLADDWQTLRQRKIDLFFFLVIVALIIGLVTRLDVCPAWQSRLIHEYLCETPYHGRLLWSAYTVFAFVRIVVLYGRDFCVRTTINLVTHHLISGEEFYKILFDGIKNSAVAIALGTTVVHVLKGMETADWKTDRAWFADFISPSLPLSWFLVGAAISWIGAASLLFAANVGMQCAFFRLSKNIAERRKLNESTNDIFRHSLLRPFCAIVFYTEFFCFLGVAAYQLSSAG